MKRKWFLRTALVSALLASGASAQVVNFHDADNWQYNWGNSIWNMLFTGQGAYLDPANDIWNGFGGYGGYQEWFNKAGGNPPQNFSNPGNPYACCNNYMSSSWVSSVGPALFNSAPYASLSYSAAGNATSAGQWTPVILGIGVPNSGTLDGGLADVIFDVGHGTNAPNGSPSFLLGCYLKSVHNEVFTLGNVPLGNTYGLYLYGINPYDTSSGGTAFSVNSGNAHNGISATSFGAGTKDVTPPLAYAEGQNFVIWENVTPDANGNITITASANNSHGEIVVNGIQLIFNPRPTALGCTPAQNVAAGDTAQFSFVPAFASNPSFRWQFVTSGATNNLTDGPNVSGSTTTNLTLSSVSAANVGLYQCVITTATATNTSPPAPLTILTYPANRVLAAGDSASFVGVITQPGDTLSDFNNQLPDVNATIPPWGDMAVNQVEDGTLYQYANFGGNGSSAPFAGPVGYIVTPKLGPTIAHGMRLYTASLYPQDDPADYLLEGSNDGGNTYTAISGGVLALPAQRNAGGGPVNPTNQVLQEVVFDNSTVYSAYRLTFTNVVNNTAASNGLQLAEDQIVGSLPPGPPTIAQQPPSAEVLLAGATLHVSVAPNGVGPFTYQWYFNATQPVGTNAQLNVNNLTGAQAGSYTCKISNPYGSATSLALSLNVVSPSSYEQAVLALNPAGYWPLNETGGSVAYDCVNGNNGTYNGGVALAQAGPVPALGSPDYSANFDGASGYVDIPGNPFSFTNPVTVIAWVNSQSISRLVDLLGDADGSYSLTATALGNPEFSDGGGTCVNTNVSINDGNWHQVVGVYAGGSGSTANAFLYVDGKLVASNEVTTVVASSHDLWIGGAPDHANRLLNGNLCDIAVIPQAITTAQVQELAAYGRFAPAVVVPASLTVDQGGSATIDSTVTGSPPLSYQWYYQANGTSYVISGATNSALALTSIVLDQASYQYYVVVSDPYGVSTSSLVQLNVNSGAPVIETDIFPLLQWARAGEPLTFSVAATGTEPFSYQWFRNSVSIAGATNSSYTFVALSDSNNYSVTVTGPDGSIPSSTAAVVGVSNAPPYVNFTGSGQNWTLNEDSIYSSYVPTMSGNVLTLIAGGDEATSSFFETSQYIGAFFASFVWQATGSQGGSFCVENDPAGPNADGGFCGGYGYAGITNSVAVMLISSSQIGLSTNGVVGNLSSCSPVNLGSGDPIEVALTYGQGVLNVSLVDAATGDAFSTSYDVNVPGLVGGQRAYVGFTGGTCNSANNVVVSDFTFLSDLSIPTSSLPALSIARGTAESVIVSWPLASTNATYGVPYQLQQSSSVEGPWTNVSATNEVVGSLFEVTLPASAEPRFYRLALQ